jgi:hypothetical protein
MSTKKDKRRKSRSPKHKTDQGAKSSITSLTAATGVEADDWDRFISDHDVIGHCATTQEELEMTRQNAESTWANEDIERMEHIHRSGRCGWAMWRN